MARTVDIPVPLSVSAGAAVSVSTLRDKWIQVTGTFVATLQLQGTIDGTNYVNEGTPITTASTTAVEVAESYTAVRMNVTAYTSGTPACTLTGHHE